MEYPQLPERVEAMPEPRRVGRPQNQTFAACLDGGVYKLTPGIHGSEDPTALRKAFMNHCSRKGISTSTRIEDGYVYVQAVEKAA